MNDINVIKDIPKEDLLTGGTFACAGCNAILGTKFVLKALGKNTILINASGCMTLTAAYPFTPYKVPWVHGAIENAASVATGISMGLKAQKKDKNVNVVCYAGDGATYDIGFQALSGAAHRNENIIYVCYNNSSFANTGFQRTSATPYGARTTTTPIDNGIGNILPRKNMTKIMALHNIPYTATASTAYPIDFMQKLQKASKIYGLKFIDLLTSCEPGWLVQSAKMIEVNKLMVQTGVWPVYEIENKNGIKSFKLNIEPRMLPAADVLKLQGRFSHLKKEDIEFIQGIINKEWEFLKVGNWWDAVEY